jgi:hypothetical protein
MLSKERAEAMMTTGAKKSLGGLVGGVLGGLAGFLSFFFLMDGLFIRGWLVPSGLQILVPAIIGAVLGAAVVAAVIGDKARLPPGE